MIIGVISDTHRHLYEIKKAVKKLKNADMIIHLGDNVEDVEKISRFFEGDIISVRGNCDISSFTPGERTEIIEGKKFFITHGHRYNVRYDLLNLEQRALEIEADIVLYGHTHISQIVFQEGIYFVNPGSPSVPRDDFCSVAKIEIKDGNITPSIINV